MPIVRDKRNGVLVRSGQVQNAETGPLFEHPAEFNQPTAIPCLQCAGSLSKNYREPSPLEAPAPTTTGFGEAVATAAGVDLAVEVFCPGRAISILPLKYAPSSITMRAVRISPVNFASLRISILSEASTLPFTVPMTQISLA